MLHCLFGVGACTKESGERLARILCAGVRGVVPGRCAEHSTLALRNPDLAALFDFCIFLLGPFLYQYVRALTLGNPLGKIFWVHLIPVLLMLFFLGLFHLLPMELKRSTIAAEQAGRRPVDPGDADRGRANRGLSDCGITPAAQVLGKVEANLLVIREDFLLLAQKSSSRELRVMAGMGGGLGDAKRSTDGGRLCRVPDCRLHFGDICFARARGSGRSSSKREG